jgi:hypothetical protein
MTVTKLHHLVRVARGEIPADMVLNGGKVVNVLALLQAVPLTGCTLKNMTGLTEDSLPFLISIMLIL